MNHVSKVSPSVRKQQPCPTTEPAPSSWNIQRPEFGSKPWLITQWRPVKVYIRENAIRWWLTAGFSGGERTSQAFYVSKEEVERLRGVFRANGSSTEDDSD